MRKCLTVAVLVMTAINASAQSKRPATFDDVLTIKAIQGEVAVSCWTGRPATA